MSEAHALPCMHCQLLPDGSHSYRRWRALAQDALHWAINDKLPVPVADTEDREAKSAALRAALLDFHRCVKSAKYITPRDAAPQPPAVS